MNRCDYCGETERTICYRFDTDEPLCRCCNHCPECKELVTKHRLLSQFNELADQQERNTFTKPYASSSDYWRSGGVD